MVVPSRDVTVLMRRPPAGGGGIEPLPIRRMGGRGIDSRASAPVRGGPEGIENDGDVDRLLEQCADGRGNVAGRGDGHGAAAQAEAGPDALASESQGAT